MAHYENLYGDIYETEEDVWDEIHNSMSWDDYAEKLEKSIGFDKLFDWAKSQDGFFEQFENEFYDAEYDYFKENYKLIEDDKEKEEG